MDLYHATDPRCNYRLVFWVSWSNPKIESEPPIYKRSTREVIPGSVALRLEILRF